MKEPLFVIVHEECITSDMALHAEGKDNDLICIESYLSVSKELSRIKREERFREVTGDPYQVEYLIPEGTDQIWVCGAYKIVCVQTHVDALRKVSKGMAIEIHEQGTISFCV